MSPAKKLSMKVSRTRSKKKQKSLPRKKVFDCAIYEIRIRYNLTIRQVADAVQMSVAGVHAIERGSDPMLSTVFKLSEFFGMRVEDIWKLAKVTR